MIQHEINVLINQPVEKVFAYLVDAQNLRAWQADLLEHESLTEGPIRVGARFREVRELYETLQKDGLPMDTLSMSMTADMEAAIAEGSTMVRIGTAIFGERQKVKDAA